MKSVSRIAAAFVAVVALGVTSSAVKAGGVLLNLDTGASSLNLGLTLNGNPLLSPNPQPIPLSGGGVMLDVGVGQISNISGPLGGGLGIFVTNPWNVNTLLGPLVLNGGHLSIGPGPGPYALAGTNVDLSGLAVSLDGGAGTILGQPFDFGADPVDFSLPNPTIATFLDFGGGLYSLTIPVSVSEDTTILNQPATYSITGQVVFSNVPEPSALSLLALGGLGLVARRRR